MPDTAADGSGQPGDGRSDSLEPRAVRYELFVGNRTSSFDERQPAFHTGASEELPTAYSAWNTRSV